MGPSESQWVLHSRKGAPVGPCGCLFFRGVKKGFIEKNRKKASSMVPIPDNSKVPRFRKATGAQPIDPADTSKRSKTEVRPGLYIVATPIGNLGDLTERAARTLEAASLIACEDTRVTGKLLFNRGIRSKLVSYHDHSSKSVRARLIKSLKEGEIVALVSDAGTPMVSDPGYKLVAAAYQAGVYVTAVPGPASPLAALVLSGLPTDRFLFAGYLPPKKKARSELIREFAKLRATLIFLESPKRLEASLSALAEDLGDRSAAVGRELTKVHEEVIRGRLKDLANKYLREGEPKGEVVILVGPPEDKPPSEDVIKALLQDALSQMSVRDAAAMVATATGAPKKEVYQRALQLARDAPGAGE